MTPLATLIARSIRWKLLAAMLLLVVAQRLAFAFIHTGNQNAIMQEALAHRLQLQRQIVEQRGRTVAEDLRRQTENDIAAFNFSSLAETLAATGRGHPDLVYAILMDATGVAYVHTSRPDLQQTTLAGAEDRHAAVRTASSRHEYGEGDRAVLEFIEPIFFGERRWGCLRLGFSLASLNRELTQAKLEHERNSRTFLLRGLRMSAVFIAASALLILWLSRALTTPIRRLTDAVQRMARGDFSGTRDIDLQAQDEVGDLSRAFDTMAGTLNDSYSRLERTAEKSRRAEAFLDSIVENLPNMVFVKDTRELRYVRVNRAGEQLLARDRKDLLGHNDYDLFARPTADLLAGNDCEALATGKLLDIPEEPVVLGAAGTRYLHTRRIPIVDPDGTPRFLLGIAEDVTALRQAQDERRLFFTHALDLLCIADFDGRFLQLNPAFPATLGYPMEELLRRPFIDFVHPDDVETTQAATARLAEGENVVSFENRYICRDGTFRWLLWSATADLATRRIYAAARDVTERRDLERHIVRIGTREQERIAHDLHDGLGQILTGLALKSQVLMEDLTAAGTPKAAERAAAIVRLANMASEQARALARGLDPVMLKEGLPAALQDLAQTTRELFGVACGFETDHFDAPIDKFESTHLYRIAQEAVNNSVRHGRPRNVGIALTSRGGQISLSVVDNGRGLGDSAAKAPGQGLRNMRYRARMIGAALSVLTNDQGGTTVICTLRRRPAASRDTHAGDQRLTDEPLGRNPP